MVYRPSATLALEEEEVEEEELPEEVDVVVAVFRYLLASEVLTQAILYRLPTG